MWENVMRSCQDLAQLASDCMKKESGVSSEHWTELANFITSCGMEFKELGTAPHWYFLVKLRLNILWIKVVVRTNVDNQVTADSEQAAASVDMQPEKAKKKGKMETLFAQPVKRISNWGPSWYNHTKIHRNIRCELPFCYHVNIGAKSESTYEEHCKYYHHRSKDCTM